MTITIKTIDDAMLEEKLLERSVRDENGCLLWDRGVNDENYGYLWNGSRSERVHRMAYRLWVGPLEEGKVLCHTCDVRNCIEPTHLIQETHSYNMQDMFAKGRNRNQHGSSINAQGIEDIRASSETGVSLAKRYGVHPATISRIRSKKRWASMMG